MPIRQLHSRSSSFQTRSLENGGFSSITRRKIGTPLNNYNHRAPKNRSNFSWWRFIRRSIPVLLVIFFAGGIIVISAFAWYSRDLPDPNKIIERDVAQSTKIFDRTGEQLLYEIHGDQRRTLVELSDIPRYAIDATISVEDKNFYKHPGISVWGILRGQIMPRLQGKRAQGGSTLTQQFVKNAILTNERALSRKIKEWILSYQLEKKFSKDEILKMYFNEIPYGSTAYGIESASRIYFSKSVKDITLPEAAALAALPQAPTYYSPYGPNKELLLERKNIVLDLMVEQNYITREEAEQAKSEVLTFNKRKDDIRAPHFVFMVQNELEERYGARLVEQDGLKITTTLDWEKQQVAENIITESTDELKNKYKANNVALVSIDVASGDILALVGSRDFFNEEIDGQVNVATSLRQPGSSLKPLVYAQTFTKGYNPKTILFDVETSFGTGGNDYRPKNYDLQERGPIAIRQALAGSLNIPAVKALYLAGVNNVIKLAKEFGYTSLNDPDRYGLSLVLGGGEVKLIEHTNAYAVFARDGIYQDSFSILKVEDSSGKILEEKPEITQKRVLDKQVARNINSILSDNGARSYIFGANNYLTLGSRPVAAKTGTTDDYRDAWVMGYTPSIVTGVWVGNNNNESMDSGSGAMAAGPVWNKYMREVMKDEPFENFPQPVAITCNKPLICGQLPEEQIIKVNKTNGERATEFTPSGDIEEKKYRDLHTILYYVDKDNPLNPEIPKDPGLDPQFNNWEDGVKRWAEKQGYLDQLPPELDDTLYSAENQPTIIWLSPTENQKITSNSLDLRVEANSKRGVVKVDYYLDNIYLGTATQAPFNLNIPIRASWKNGPYILKAIAYDDVNNFNNKNISIILEVKRVDFNIKTTWLQPIPSQNYSKNSLPQKIEINVDNYKDIKKVDFWYVYEEQNNYIGVIEKPQNNTLSLNWSPNKGVGAYKLYLLITDIFGNVDASEEIVINIKD